ncbi:hypothetical protein EDI_204380 [Entamoeba dispar SAW760]|uniref:Uncharacterized protein n=1 Tax=Entamoeba dispar (strain ATCC PRA-260 / SAW760) TaxID=370354 RepID=B0ESL2_ENTDS|nr:uncharacterized protein EDI_204380 [Entamoeba dispar SAW760]EDR22506.1 hypothetical protein EDI_204380 [Entamoeba dispar SAW760]|eukprot:EDR22506.1 hypothetical protein EDI_204380 [Entamoeba dispar SAW760]
MTSVSQSETKNENNSLTQSPSGTPERQQTLDQKKDQNKTDKPKKVRSIVRISKLEDTVDKTSSKDILTTEPFIDRKTIELHQIDILNDKEEDLQLVRQRLSSVSFIGRKTENGNGDINTSTLSDQGKTTLILYDDSCFLPEEEDSKKPKERHSCIEVFGNEEEEPEKLDEEELKRKRKKEIEEFKLFSAKRKL